MEESMSYPAKLMLFGEYTVITGSKAIAIPLWKFKGSWVKERRSEDWPFDLQSFLDYLRIHNKKIGLDLQAIKKDLDNGWWFKSDVPTGFGVGSSGSFVAGLFDRYSNSTTSDLRRTLATIESFFHGQSSGLDPLISLTDRSIMIGSAGTYKFINKPDHSSSNFEIWLINSSKPRRTQPLVDRFKEKLSDPLYNRQISEEITPLVNELIGSYVETSQNNDKIWELWAELSLQQKSCFSEMIIPDISTLWDQGLDSGIFKLKLCGAGGGGFYLSIVRKKNRKEFLSSLKDIEAFRVGY